MWTKLTYDLENRDDRRGVGASAVCEMIDAAQLSIVRLRHHKKAQEFLDVRYAPAGSMVWEYWLKLIFARRLQLMLTQTACRCWT
jgi:hypothetical protein